jgi:hypothetical protein
LWNLQAVFGVAGEDWDDFAGEIQNLGREEKFERKRKL